MIKKALPIVIVSVVVLAVFGGFYKLINPDPYQHRFNGGDQVQIKSLGVKGVVDWVYRNHGTLVVIFADKENGTVNKINISDHLLEPVEARR